MRSEMEHLHAPDDFRVELFYFLFQASQVTQAATNQKS
jgi:hypothetical protein